MGLFDKLKSTLAKTRQSFGENVNAVFAGFRKVADEFLEELLEVVIMSVVGVEV